ncbi:MAG: PQQ-binding-like beta-propeller repeat protein [Phycisphaerae bacterium]|nr:PQQ-binding-like beta-propeller repeat protein [Phycisphaerae bacterium]
MKHNSAERFIVFVTPLLALASAHADEWSQFRGPRGDGVVAELTHPLSWSANENLLWKTALPGTGWSAPVVVGNRVFISTASGGSLKQPKKMSEGVADPASFGLGGRKPSNALRFELHCLDLATGRILWSQLIAEEEPKLAIHPSNTFATETPAADAERVCVAFGTIGKLAAFSHEGKELWRFEYEPGKVDQGFGTGSSLALFEDRLFLQNDNEKQSTLTALRLSNGEKIWAVTRDCDSSWATPLVWRNSKRVEVVACGGGKVMSYDPKDGAMLWEMGGIDSAFSASAASNADYLVFANSGPFSQNFMYAIRPGAAGDITLKAKETSNEGVAWRVGKPGVGMCSPLIFDGLIYAPAEGKLKTFDVATGAEVYRQRLPEAELFVSSAWAGAGHVLMLDEAGRTYVLQAGREFKLLNTNRIEDTFWATPAIAGAKLLLRGVNGLYCIGK